jgi:hypothetical protein
VAATAQLSFTISPATMTHIFPHLEKEARLGSRLLGKKLEVACEITFEFESQGLLLRVTSCNMKLELIAALWTVLDRLGDVAAVLSQARITPEGVIGGTEPSVEVAPPTDFTRHSRNRYDHITSTEQADSTSPLYKRQLPFPLICRPPPPLYYCIFPV